jgi:hypothetical protein
MWRVLKSLEKYCQVQLFVGGGFAFLKPAPIIARRFLPVF